MIDLHSMICVGALDLPDGALWRASWDRSLDGREQPFDVLEHPDLPTVIAWARERVEAVLVYGRDGRLYWAGVGESPADLETWESAPAEAR